jgi:4-diphosphocytidyl-2-C-methyl-D-erythritol kinase
MKINAYAKINWDLFIQGKRADGFHAIDTVMVNVSLHDVLHFEPSDAIALTCTDPSLPTDGSNLIVRAAERLRELSGTRAGAAIHLEKRIPAGGGMGGGSSDAATTLLGLNRFWNLNWPVEKLQPIAAELGSDIAFFLYGGWCRCRGRGEIVERIPGSEQFPTVPLLLILPPLHCSTPAVYKALNAAPLPADNSSRPLECLTEQLSTDLKTLANPGTRLDVTHLFNSLMPAAKAVEPRLGAIQDVLETHYKGRWLMSGSGAVHFVLTGDDGAVLEKELKAIDPRVRVVRSETHAHS